MSTESLLPRPWPGMAIWPIEEPGASAISYCVEARGRCFRVNGPTKALLEGLQTGHREPMAMTAFLQERTGRGMTPQDVWNAVASLPGEVLEGPAQELKPPPAVPFQIHRELLSGPSVEALAGVLRGLVRGPAAALTAAGFALACAYFHILRKRPIPLPCGQSP